MTKFETEVILPIVELLEKEQVEEAVKKTKELSEDDQCEVVQYILDNLYEYTDNEEEDEEKNKVVLSYQRNFFNICEILLEHNNDKDENGEYVDYIDKIREKRGEPFESIFKK